MAYDIHFTATTADWHTKTFYPKQVHGVASVNINSQSQRSEVSAQHADIIFTKSEMEWIAVQTADCLPVLLASGDNVMAVHAGWRGLCQRILREAFHLLKNESTAEQCHAWFGPSISQSAFEVGPEVIAEFDKAYSQDFDVAPFVQAGKADRSHIDLQGVARRELISLGLEENHIAGSNVCTFTHGDWHSYRRDGRLAGRNWAYIRRT